MTKHFPTATHECPVRRSGGTPASEARDHVIRVSEPERHICVQRESSVHQARVRKRRKTYPRGQQLGGAGHQSCACCRCLPTRTCCPPRTRQSGHTEPPEARQSTLDDTWSPYNHMAAQPLTMRHSPDVDATDTTKRTTRASQCHHYPPARAGHHSGVHRHPSHLQTRTCASHTRLRCGWSEEWGVCPPPWARSKHPWLHTQ